MKLNLPRNNFINIANFTNINIKVDLYLKKIRTFLSNRNKKNIDKTDRFFHKEKCISEKKFSIFVFKN